MWALPLTNNLTIVDTTIIRPMKAPMHQWQFPMGMTVSPISWWLQCHTAPPHSDRLHNVCQDLTMSAPPPLCSINLLHNVSLLDFWLHTLKIHFLRPRDRHHHHHRRRHHHHHCILWNYTPCGGLALCRINLQFQIHKYTNTLLAALLFSEWFSNKRCCIRGHKIEQPVFILVVNMKQTDKEALKII